MTILDPALWTVKIFLGGWTEGGGEDILVREPATGQQLGRLGSASGARCVPGRGAGVRRATAVGTTYASGTCAGKAAGEVPTPGPARHPGRQGRTDRRARRPARRPPGPTRHRRPPANLRRHSPRRLNHRTAMRARPGGGAPKGFYPPARHRGERRRSVTELRSP
jgi:hypothetical protein